jgi:hypothetical protein
MRRMRWKFWKWGAKQAEAKETPKPRQAPWLPKPYAERQIIALQRTVGNQVVLKWLGLRS